MISFENTEIAFESKSDKDLNRAYWLFKIVGNRSMVKFGKWATNLALKIHLPVKGIIKKTIFRQFCGGETIQECSKTINSLGEFGIGTILDYSVEGKVEEEDFDNTVQEFIETIKMGKTNPNIPFAVFKLTGICRFSVLEAANSSTEKLTEKQLTDYNKLVERVDKICKAGYENNVPVFIDAEETWIQDTVDRIAFEMMLKYNKERGIVYNTLQMYRHDRLSFLKECHTLSLSNNIIYGVKLVRGAYMEKERKRAEELNYQSPIQKTKADSDKDYNLALEYLVQHINQFVFCAGTHNEESSLFLTELMSKHKLENTDERIYFAQLLGMSDHISYNLSKSEYKVAKYVPYGPVKEVMPYLLRRADENTSVAGQTGRELGLIIKEKNRRKTKKVR